MNSNSHSSSQLKHLLTVHCQPEQLVSIGLTPDGQNLVVGEKSKIQVWNVSAKQPAHTLIKVSGCLSIGPSVAMSADGKILVCVSGRGIVKAWNLHTTKQLLTFKPHRYPISLLALSSDGRFMASSANDRTLRVWDLKKLREVGLRLSSPAVILCFAFTSNGQKLVYNRFKSLIVWQWKTDDEMELEGHEEDVASVASAAISGDGNTVASGSNQTIKLWNLTTGEEMHTLTGHSSYVFSVAMSADGQTLISGDIKYQFKLWDLVTGRALFSWKEDSDVKRGRVYVAISADGRTLACGSGDTVKVWQMP